MWAIQLHLIKCGLKLKRKSNCLQNFALQIAGLFYTLSESLRTHVSVVLLTGTQISCYMHLPSEDFILEKISLHYIHGFIYKMNFHEKKCPDSGCKFQIKTMPSNCWLLSKHFLIRRPENNTLFFNVKINNFFAFGAKPLYSYTNFPLILKRASAEQSYTWVKHE